MIVSACFGEDKVHPSKLKNCTNSDRAKKEAVVFDTCMKVVKEKLGKHLTFDGHLVNVAYYTSRESKEYMSTRHL